MGSVQAPAYGRRLFPAVIDEYARTEPRKIWGSMPKSTSLQDGFRDVDYSMFANAINRAAWWLDDRLGKGSNFQTIAYIGASDFRYFVYLFAAIKVGYTVSRFISSESVTVS
jgi:hypothetical protein